MFEFNNECSEHMSSYYNFNLRIIKTEFHQHHRPIIKISHKSLTTTNNQVNAKQKTI